MLHTATLLTGSSVAQPDGARIACVGSRLGQFTRVDKPFSRAYGAVWFPRCAAIASAAGASSDGSHCTYRATAVGASRARSIRRTTLPQPRASLQPDASGVAAYRYAGSFVPACAGGGASRLPSRYGRRAAPKRVAGSLRFALTAQMKIYVPCVTSAAQSKRQAVTTYSALTSDTHLGRRTSVAARYRSGRTLPQ
jgi:hypothetical protein